MAWLKVSLPSRSVGTEDLLTRDLDFGGDVRFGERVFTAFADDFIRSDFFIELITLPSNDASIVVDTETVKVREVASGLESVLEQPHVFARSPKPLF